MTLNCSAPLRAIVLAAGRGERMRPLTDHTPKPLLPILGRPMIEWHLLALARDGVREVLINTAWLEDQFPATLGDGSRFGLSLHYAHEGRDFGGALETAGGIKTALPWLIEGGREAFWVVSGDIWAPDFRFDPKAAERFRQSGQHAHLWLVPNPVYHPTGDFDIATPDGTLERLTYANLALMRPALLDSVAAGQRSALGPLLHQGLRKAQIGLERYTGRWENIGTPAQWAALQTPAA
ncbi:MAG: NDP-sugar synthase [Leptothrix ochracea]|uniref:nucleotidyltransferase family protein n=1 Tax=Leptothrix ochracea TaxID=735331 RepID=UPI0034E2803F